MSDSTYSEMECGDDFYLPRECLTCGEIKPVCCDDGFEGWCKDCCQNNHRAVWDGKAVAGGTYWRGE